MDQQKNSSWLTWCREHRSWLAAHFLEQVDSGEPVRPFFGSWFDVQGRKMTGYYLGHELIADLHERMGLKEIAAMQQVSQLLRPMVEEMAVS